MNRKDQFRTLLKKLYDKSVEDKVRWQPIYLEADDDNAKAFRIDFANGTTVTLQYIAGSRGPDLIDAGYQIKDRVLERIFTEDGTDDFDFLWELIQEAERCVIGWDKLLEESVKELDHDGIVGIPIPSGYSSTPSPTQGASR